MKELSAYGERSVVYSPALRKVLKIHQLNESSVKEIAELAGLSIAATKSRLLRRQNRPA
jgi:DNA-directed RNA polymerase specialized sigma24 family protein